MKLLGLPAGWAGKGKRQAPTATAESLSLHRNSPTSLPSPLPVGSEWGFPEGPTGRSGEEEPGPGRSEWVVTHGGKMSKQAKSGDRTLAGAAGSMQSGLQAVGLSSPAHPSGWSGRARRERVGRRQEEALGQVSFSLRPLRSSPKGKESWVGTRQPATGPYPPPSLAVAQQNLPAPVHLRN